MGTPASRRGVRARLRRAGAARTAPVVVAVVGVMTASASVATVAVGLPQPVPVGAAQPAPTPPDPGAMPAAAAAATRSDAAPVAALTERVRPDAVVTAPAPLSADQLRALSALGRTVVVRAGTVTIGGRPVAAVAAVGVDPSSFRGLTAPGTAEADAVWQAVARGELVASHAVGGDAGLTLGGPVPVTPAGGGAPTPLRLGALATTGLPRSDIVVDDATAARLGLQPATGVLVVAPPGTDAAVLGGRVREVAGSGVQVDLLNAPASPPVSFLTGSKAAAAFGSFSYKYYPDGTIEPDPAWVRANIVDATVPILGRVTCHRLMVPQLRAALQEVQDSGLGGLLRTYDGCFVPRFIPNTDKAVSLHAWGIAIDMDASTNYRGIRGTMDDRIVAIMKKWGFRWGGDWSYTDPMHFELGALLVNADGTLRPPR